MALYLYAKDESAGGSITLIVWPFDAILWGHLIWAVLERQPRLQAKKPAGQLVFNRLRR
jgi:hypothetical protein